MLFIIGTIGILILSVLCFFLPTFYTQNWGYASIIGFGSSVSQGDKSLYTLGDTLAYFYNRVSVNAFLYLGLSFFESIVWEFLRPLVLNLFNPLNKTPKALLGDCLAYALGNLVFLAVNGFIIKISKDKRR